MGLSPEEKRRIYEEEKARMEAEKQAAGDNSTTNLKPNVASLLCYVGFWVTGIIFLVIERKNKLVRFHAMQSLVTFGIINIVWGVANTVRYWLSGWVSPGWLWQGVLYPQYIVATVIFGVFFAIWWILWAVLMHQTHHGRLVRVLWFGDVAMTLLAKLDSINKRDLEQALGYRETQPEPEPPPTTVAGEDKQTKEKVHKHFEDTRTSRIVSSSAVIAWSAIFLVFFNFFNEYLAYYQRVTIDGVTKWNIYPLLTQDFSSVLPILNTTLILAIAGHIVLIIMDKYFLRQITVLVLNILGMVTVLTFLRVFPFDFSVIPNSGLATILPTVAVVVFILITVGLGIGALVRFIKLIVHVTKSR